MLSAAEPALSAVIALFVIIFILIQHHCYSSRSRSSTACCFVCFRPLLTEIVNFDRYQTAPNN
jgi:hypothetical protein